MPSPLPFPPSLASAELAQEGEIFYDALTDSEQTADAKIIGIFKEIQPQADADIQPTAGLRANMMFSDHAFISDLGTVNEGEYTGAVVGYESGQGNQLNMSKIYFRKQFSCGGSPFK